MAGWTNKGKFRVLEAIGQGAALPASFNLALVTSAVAPGPDTNVMSDLTQIATGNGYADGGINVARNATDFDVVTEDDTGDAGFLQIKDIVWTASGGPIPASGAGARYAVLTDNNVTVSAREIWYYWDLTEDRTVSDTQTLTLQDCEIRINEA